MARRYDAGMTTKASVSTSAARHPAKAAPPVRVGIVGVGMGRFHVGAFRAAEGCEVAALCDMDEKRLARVATELAVAHTFTDAQTMFDSEAVDLAVIATPNFTHHPLTMAALRAGLHVLCEKPLAMNAAEAREMVEAATRHKRKLAIHFNHRMGPQAWTIAQFVRGGHLGEPSFARAIWHRRRGIPGGASGWFRTQRTAGGGCLIDLGVHILDQVLFAFDYPRVLAVTGQTVNHFGATDAPTGMDVEDMVTAYLRCANGLTVSLEVSWACHHEHPEQVHIALYGSKAGIVRHQEHYKDEPVRVYHRLDGKLATTTLDTLDPAMSVQQDLIAAIRDNREPLCSAAHGLATMRIIDAIYESARTGREVRLD